MTTIAVYRTSDNALVSSTNDPAQVPPAAELAAKGMASIDTGKDTTHRAQFKFWDWNPSTLTFDEVDLKKGYVRRHQFYRFWTIPELRDLIADTNTNIVDGRQIIEMRDGISLDDPQTDAWLNLCVTRNILTAARRDEIINLIRRQ